MINSPSGGLEVAIYTDTEGRIFSVNPNTNQVVEETTKNVEKSAGLLKNTLDDLLNWLIGKSGSVLETANIIMSPRDILEMSPSSPLSILR